VISRLGLNLKTRSKTDLDKPIPEKTEVNLNQQQKVTEKSLEKAQQPDNLSKQPIKEQEIEKEKSPELERSKIKAVYSPLKYVGDIPKYISESEVPLEDKWRDNKEPKNAQLSSRAKSDVLNSDVTKRLSDYSQQLEVIQREGKENFSIREKTLEDEPLQTKSAREQQNKIHESISSLNSNPSQSRVISSFSKGEHKNRKIKILDPFAKLGEPDSRTSNKNAQHSMKNSSVKESLSKSKVNNSPPPDVYEQKEQNGSKKNLSNTQRSKLILDRLTSLLMNMGGDYQISPGSADMTDED